MAVLILILVGITYCAFPAFAWHHTRSTFFPVWAYGWLFLLFYAITHDLPNIGLTATLLGCALLVGLLSVPGWATLGLYRLMFPADDGRLQ